MLRALPRGWFGLVLALVAWARPAVAGDWPMWRYDAQRSAASSEELPRQLRLQWIRALPRLKPAWPDQPKLQFDAAYEPVVAGGRLFVGSSNDDSVTAYNARTGEPLWQFFADGPVRFAPLVWQERLYFVSDDGYLYCLRANDGALNWRFRGGPSDRKVLGNERLISTWPARGAPVLVDGKIYFAAGIWPFMGIFLHALDATTGDVHWTSDGDGSIYIKQPHNADSFAGVAPQGPLVACGDKLLIPGGRSVPAAYDRTTGQLLYYQLAENGKRGGGSAVAAVDKLLFNGGAAFDLETEKYLGVAGDLITFSGGRLHDYRNLELRTLELGTSQVELVDSIDRKGLKIKVAKWSIKTLGKAESPHLTAMIQAGSRLYAGSEGRLLSIALPLPEKGKAVPIWEAEIEGTPLSLIAADGSLFASTLQGRLYCFGDTNPKLERAAPLQSSLTPRAGTGIDEAWSAKAESILKRTGIVRGYCLAWGVGSGGLVTEMARQSDLRLVVIEPDRTKADVFRTKLQAWGIGSERISVLVADPLQVDLPPYFASLMVAEILPFVESKDRDQFIGRAFAALRPFGGTAYLQLNARRDEAYANLARQLPLEGAVWKPMPDGALLIREGALPDSANWTHEHADAANTRVSKDKRVKAPLGLLWFGGPSNEGVLPRHGHGPQPQVVDGRLFIEGVDMLRGLDIYTGSVLWETKLPGLGALYDNTAHQPGANAAGTNYIATPVGIYVAYRNTCLRLDPATGKKLDEFSLPGLPTAKEKAAWGYINVFEDYLVGGAEPLFDPKLAPLGSRLAKPVVDDDDEPKKATETAAASSSSLGDAANALVNKVLKIDNDNYSSSQRLVVMDRRNGKPHWSAKAQSGFRHNAICIGGGRIYCIDRLSAAQLSRLKRRGEEAPHKPRLVVFNLATGAEIWSSEQDVFGTWLSYSADRDILVEAGRSAGDTLLDEPKGMRAYRAGNGSPLWNSKTFSGPAMIHHDTILMAGNACDLLTGAPRMREHPLSGELMEWTWSRNYGCNTPAASEHLLTFRSGAAGYLDFCNDGGTGNFGGFRSSCTNNLIVAGGVLSAPEYTRTCVCSYQNQTSLALVPMPEVETWTSFGSQTPKQAVRNVGINLAAPGDRKAEDGTLWLEYPSVGGSSPTIAIKAQPEKPEWFRRHSSQIEGAGPSWVAASGAKGLTSIQIKLIAADRPDPPSRLYTVRLHFMEPDDVRPGERIFEVKMQGKTVLAAVDVVKEAGIRNRSLVREFSGVEVQDDLQIDLLPDPMARVRASVLSGIEIHSEGW